MEENPATTQPHQTFFKKKNFFLLKLQGKLHYIITKAQIIYYPRKNKPITPLTLKTHQNPTKTCSNKSLDVQPNHYTLMPPPADLTTDPFTLFLSFSFT